MKISSALPNKSGLLGRFARYTAVALAIRVLSLGLLYVLTDIAGIWYMASAVLTTIILFLLGYIMNAKWTWSSQVEGAKFARKLLSEWKRPKHFIATSWNSAIFRYYLTGLASVLLGWALLYIFTEFANIWYILSSIISSVIILLTTFWVRDIWIWES